VKELKELGFSAKELEEAGFTRRAVEAVDGRSVRELKEDGGYQVRELKEYGYVVADLRTIYTVKDIKDQGYSFDELRAGGMPEHVVLAVDGRSTKELRGARYQAKVLRKIGFHLEELADGGFTATELKAAGYGADHLRMVGFTAEALRVAGFTSKQLHAARYSLKEMQEGGFLWQDLVVFLKATHAQLTRAGFTGLNPNDRLFLLNRPEREQIFLCRSKLKMRETESLDSADAGSLAEGVRVCVLKRRTLEDGTTRALVTLESDPKPLGWITECKDGIFNLGVLDAHAQEISLQIPDNGLQIDIDVAAARLASATATAGAWAAKVWAAAGAWAEAAVAVSGTPVNWSSVGPEAVTQRDPYLTRRSSRQELLTTPRAASTNRLGGLRSSRMSQAAPRRQTQSGYSPPKSPDSDVEKGLSA